MEYTTGTTHSGPCVNGGHTGVVMSQYDGCGRATTITRGLRMTTPIVPPFIYGPGYVLFVNLTYASTG